MSVAIIGRQRLFTVGASTILGVSTKGATCNNEPIDVTDDNSSGWIEILETAGAKSVEYPISGTLKNLELFESFFNSVSQKFAISITYPDGSVMTFDGFMSNIAETGESNTGVTFDATFVSAGVVTFVAGT